MIAAEPVECVRQKRLLFVGVRGFYLQEGQWNFDYLTGIRYKSCFEINVVDCAFNKKRVRTINLIDCTFFRNVQSQLGRLFFLIEASTIDYSSPFY